MGLRWMGYKRVERNTQTRICMLCIHQILIGHSNQDETDGQCMWYLWGAVEVHILFWWKDPIERDHLEDLCLDGRIILK